MKTIYLLIIKKIEKKHDIPSRGISKKGKKEDRKKTYFFVNN